MGLHLHLHHTHMHTHTIKRMFVFAPPCLCMSSYIRICFSVCCRPVYCGWSDLRGEPNLHQTTWRRLHDELYLLWTRAWPLEVWCHWWVYLVTGLCISICLMFPQSWLIHQHTVYLTEWSKFVNVFLSILLIHLLNNLHSSYIFNHGFDNSVYLRVPVALLDFLWLCPQISAKSQRHEPSIRSESLGINPSMESCTSAIAMATASESSAASPSSPTPVRC